jgi:K+-transporting ATPase ATPase A chain
MTGKPRHGWAVFAAMAILFLAAAFIAGFAEQHGNPIHQHLGVASADGNMEGKEVRFGIGDSALFAAIMTDASCGAVNAMHDSFTPLGGSIPLLNIMLGEIVFGGVGAGLYGMFLFIVLAVFIAGLMVGRTPEYLGKKIEAHDVKLAMLAVLILAFCILVGTAAAAVTKAGTSSVNNAGPHGLSELTYAFASAAGNNGSAFAGLNANSRFYNLALGVAMFFGRFLMIIPLVGIAGSLASKKRLAEGAGTFPVDGPLFTALLVGVILIVGALTYFPVLALGPYVEHFLMNAGKVF